MASSSPLACVVVQVQLLIRVLQKAEASNLPVFTYQFSELSKVLTPTLDTRAPHLGGGSAPSARFLGL